MAVEQVVNRYDGYELAAPVITGGFLFLSNRPRCSNGALLGDTRVAGDANSDVASRDDGSADRCVVLVFAEGTTTTSLVFVPRSFHQFATKTASAVVPFLGAGQSGSS